jgi:hypothetical protein
MADRSLHLALGLAIGTMIFIPKIICLWRGGRSIYMAIAQLLIASYGLGFLAVVPNILRRIGVPASVCNVWWMNVFVLNPALDRFRPGGYLIGGLLVAGIFALHYCLLVCAIRRGLAIDRPTVSV